MLEFNRGNLYLLSIIIFYCVLLLYMFSSNAQENQKTATNDYANLPQGSAILEINNVPNDVNVQSIILGLPNANDGYDTLYKTGPIKSGAGPRKYYFRHNLTGPSMYFSMTIQKASTEDATLQFKGLCSLTRPEPNKTNINIVKYSFDIPANPPKTPPKSTETVDPTKSGKILMIKETDSQGNELGHCFLEKYESPGAQANP